MVAPITAGTSTTSSALGGSSAIGWAGFGADIVGGALGSYWSGEAARDQWAHQKKMMQKAYQWRVDDLKKAGLNPMLAVGQNVGVPQAAQMERENPVRGVASSALQLQMAKKQMQNVDANTELALWQGIKAKADARGTNLVADITEIERDFAAQNAQQRYDTMVRQYEQLGAEIKATVADTRLKDQEYAFNAKMNELRQRAQILDNLSVTYGLDKAKAESGFYRDVGKYVYYTREGSDVIGSLVGAGARISGASSAAKTAAAIKNRYGPK